MDYQGKRKDQIQSSEKLAAISMIGMILLILAAWICKLWYGDVRIPWNHLPLGID